ncbi:Epoxide hydrolase-like, partial [Parasponia andersonii]
EQGTGPLVLLLHGFPELWFSWRHQMAHLAKHGYHVVASDMRGYGDSDSPLSPKSYTVIHLVGDIVGLIDHFGEKQAFVVGHDWGAYIGWHLSLFRPDRVKALVALSAPYFERSQNTRSPESFRQMFGDGCYIWQFQVPFFIILLYACVYVVRQWSTIITNAYIKY